MRDRISYGSRAASGGVVYLEEWEGLTIKQ